MPILSAYCRLHALSSRVDLTRYLKAPQDSRYDAMPGIVEWPPRERVRLRAGRQRAGVGPDHRPHRARPVRSSSACSTSSTSPTATSSWSAPWLALVRRGSHRLVLARAGPGAADRLCCWALVIERLVIRPTIAPGVADHRHDLRPVDDHAGGGARDLSARSRAAWPRRSTARSAVRHRL